MILVFSSYLLLRAVFAFCGLGKLRSLPVFSRQVADYQLIPGSLVRPAAVVIAGGEIVCAVLLAVPPTRRPPQLVCTRSTSCSPLASPLTS
jgi:uncharacterized membrane protein YphA (DoxX/SURF4 family)